MYGTCLYPLLSIFILNITSKYVWNMSLLFCEYLRPHIILKICITKPRIA